MAAGLLLSGLVGVGSAEAAPAIDRASLLPDKCPSPAVRNLSDAQIRERYRPVDSDQFSIVFLDACALWNLYADEGTNKQKINLGVWEPDSHVMRAYPDYFYPGELAVTFRENTWKITGVDQAATFLIKPKPGFEHLIKRPRDYSFVGWTNGKGNSDNRATFFRPNCPEGYVPLGDIAESGLVDADQPGGLDRRFTFDIPISCVQRSATVDMEPYAGGFDPDGALYSTRGIEKSMDWAMYGVQRKGERSPEKDNFGLTPATYFITRDGYGVPDRSLFRGLKVKLKPLDLQSPTNDLPHLSSADIASLSSTSTPKEYEVSAFDVQDPQYSSELARFVASPKYIVRRTTKWKPLDRAGYQCPASRADGCTYEATTTESESKSTTWNNNVGGSVSVGYELKLKAAPLGVGAEATVTFGVTGSYSHDFGGEEQKGSEASVTKGETLNPGEFGAWVQAESTYQIYRKGVADPKNLVREYTAAQPATALATYVPQKAAANTSGCSSDAEECELPFDSIATIPREVPVYSESGGHYLYLSPAGALEVRLGDVGVDQDVREGASEGDLIWSLDQKHQYGRDGHAITNVEFENGQLVVSAIGLPDWKSSSKTYDNAKLLIDDKGNLRIDVPRGDADDGKTRTVWNSKNDKGEG